MERALAIHEAAYGPDHPQLASDRINLGVVLRDLGDLAGARRELEGRCHRRGGLRARPSRGRHRPQHLGAGLRDLGDLVGARRELEWALAIDEAAYGPDHPWVAVVRINLGSVLRDLGDLVGARREMERALAIYEAAYGPDHPATQAARSHLEGL